MKSTIEQILESNELPCIEVRTSRPATLVPWLAVQVAWLSMLLLLAYAVGEVNAARRIARHDLDHAHTLVIAAQIEALRLNAEAQADLNHARAALKQAQALQRQNGVTTEGADAAQVSSL